MEFGMATFRCVILVYFSTTAVVADLSFLFIGDWGSDRSQQHDVAESMSRWCDQHPCNFVVTGGDNFYPDGVISATDERFNTTWKNVYNRYASLKDLVWYASLGNHDHGAIDRRELYQVEYSTMDSQWYMPNLTYDFKHEFDGIDCHFLALDTNSLFARKHDWESQLTYMETVLNSTTSHWRIVYGHHNAYSSGDYPGNPVIKERVDPFMRINKVDLYLTGHDHNLQHIVRENGTDVDYVISGAGGRSLYEYRNASHALIRADGLELKYFGYVYGFVYVNLQVERAHVQYIDVNTNILYEFFHEK